MRSSSRTKENNPSARSSRPRMPNHPRGLGHGITGNPTSRAFFSSLLTEDHVARIPYADPDRPEVQDIVRRITAERGSVLHLYRMLLHSPPVAAGWLACFTAIRQQSSLPGDLRELVIMRIAIVNGASYEAEQHAPIALREGLTQAQLDALPDW